MIIPDFYTAYIKFFNNVDCIEALKKEYIDSKKFYNNIDNKTSLFRYNNDKWSIRELLGHICDSEQVFAFRLLSILRDEKNPLPGFDHNQYVKVANFNSQSWNDLLKRFEIIRESTLRLCKSIEPEDYKKIGNANGNDISLEALIFVIAGHERHHRKIIKERYLN